MKTLSTYPSDRYGCAIVVMNALLTVVLTILSFPKVFYITARSVVSRA